MTIDDATGKITSLFLVEEESTASSFLGLSETVARYGLFSRFYTDRASHDFITSKAGEAVDRTHQTQKQTSMMLWNRTSSFAIDTQAPNP